MAVSFLKPPECQRILRLLILPTNDVSLCLYSTYRVAPYCPTENPDTSFVEKKKKRETLFFFFILLIREGRELFHHTEDFRATPVLIPFFMIYYFFLPLNKKKRQKEKKPIHYIDQSLPCFRHRTKVRRRNVTGILDELRPGAAQNV